jgi:glycosyltransferase involved in cell wall biosynthesis
MNAAEIAHTTKAVPADRSIVRVLVVGQTPPPIHGQSIMIKMLLDGELPGVELYHVRMAFSDDMNQVGRFRLGKLSHLLYVILNIVYYRFRFGIRILYYPPAGPNLVPLLRDVAILLSTRWLFSKTIFHFHACGVTEFIARSPLPLKWLAGIAMSKPAAAVQLSELTGSDPKALAAKRIYTIPNAAPDEAKGMSPEGRPSATAGSLRLLYVGTVCEGKGVLVLLNAMAEALRAGKKLHLDIVGSFQPTEFREQVEQHIESMGAKDLVQIWGQQTGRDKWLRFANADVFCFPSHYQSEGFPCVLLEAMCFALPIVSTQWRGIPSIVKHGETGFLTATHDQGALSEHLQSLADDPELCKRLGRAGRERYCQYFTVEKYIEGLRNMFLEIGQSRSIDAQHTNS